MSQETEKTKPADNMEKLEQEASGCGAGCGCHTTGTSGKTRWVIGAIILVAAVALAARAVLKSDVPAPQAAAPAFAAPVAGETWSCSMPGKAYSTGSSMVMTFWWAESMAWRAA